MTKVHQLSRTDARRIAVRAQLLDDDRPTDLVSVVRHLTILQIDPISAIAPGTCAAELENHQVTVHRRLTPALVHGDVELLEQLVLNLVQNAIRHNQPAGDSLWVTTAQYAEEAVLEIHNTGPAVAHHDLEPARRHQPGPGVSIVRSVAHAHDGSVVAKLREGDGLTVTVRLPALVRPRSRI